MIHKKDNDVLIELARRHDPNCKDWHCYVLGYWVCYICHNPITDPEEHGIKHLEEMGLDSFR